MSEPAGDQRPRGPVYLDAAGSEALHPAARDTLQAALDRGYADPRRLHGPGRDARLLLDNAREVIADALDVRPDEVTFTASGTDAVHRGLLGLLAAGPGARLVHSAVEHSSVLHAARWARHTWGSTFAEAPVTPTGRLDLERLPATAAGASVLALQSANHEVGTIQPVADALAVLAAAAPGASLFLDACASAGRLPLPGGWSAAAASAHKWGGPSGVGLLLVRRRSPWRPPYPADDRSDPRAVGFENVPAALAAAAALQAVVAERAERSARERALIDLVRARVAELPDVEVVGDPDDRLPHLVTFSFLYVDGEALVTELDRHGFGIASGSACTSSSLTPSHVLAAMGALTHGNARLSLARDTTADDIERFLTVLPEVVAEIRARVAW